MQMLLDPAENPAMKPRLVFALVILALLGSGPATADWPADPSSSVPIFPGQALRSSACAADGAGGLFVLGRPVNDTAMLAQHLDAFGEAQWAPAGVAAGPLQSAWSGWPALETFASADGAGGALVMWTSPWYTLRMQRIAPGGFTSWQSEGEFVSDTCASLQSAAVASDGLGGALAVWCERRSLGYDYYAQRMSGAGSRRWGASGILLGSIAPEETLHWQQWLDLAPKVTADGAGGAYFSFTGLGTPNHNLKTFVQRVDASGAGMWAGGGIELFPMSYEAVNASACSDGVGGLIVAADGIDTIQTTPRRGIWLQRLDRLGNHLWGHAGSLVQTGTAGYYGPRLVSDGAGGAFVVWWGYPAGVLVQHVHADGTLTWATPVRLGGFEVGTSMVALADGAGGAIVVWEPSSGGILLRAQRIGPDGTTRWGPEGILLMSQPGVGYYGLQLRGVPDGAGGAYVTWLDGSGICRARWVSAEGFLGTTDVPAPRASRTAWLKLHPSPSNGPVVIRFSVPGSPPARLDVFDVGGRRVRALWSGGSDEGLVGLDWDGRDAAGSPLPNGLYLIRLSGESLSLTSRVILFRR